MVSTNIVGELLSGRTGTGASGPPAATVRQRTTTILLIDEPGIPRDGLCALLESESTLEVIAVAAGRRDALQALRVAQPHVVVMNLSVNPLASRETIAHIKRRYPRLGILVLIQPGHKHIEAALRAGADGYVLLDEDCDQLFNAVRRVGSGKDYISPAALNRMVTSYTKTADPATLRSPPPEVLTNREREVIALIAKGYRTREMAQLLSLSHKTVEKHRANLMRKLALRSAAAAAAYAITHGLAEGVEVRGTR